MVQRYVCPIFGISLITNARYLEKNGNPLTRKLEMPPVREKIGMDQSIVHQKIR